MPERPAAGLKSSKLAQGPSKEAHKAPASVDTLQRRNQERNVAEAMNSKVEREY